MRLAASNERDFLLHGGPKWRAVMHSQTPDRPSIMSVHVERMRASDVPEPQIRANPSRSPDAGDEAIGYAHQLMHGVEAGEGAKATTNRSCRTPQAPVARRGCYGRGETAPGDAGARHASDGAQERRRASLRRLTSRRAPGSRRSAAPPQPRSRCRMTPKPTPARISAPSRPTMRTKNPRRRGILNDPGAA